MKQVLILNDVHLGVSRSAGTTPTTAANLKQYLLTNLKNFMFEHLDKDILFNGDVFDQFNVPLTDVFNFFDVCQQWLDASGDGNLILAEGNHDLSKNSANMCSLAFVAKTLNTERVRLVEQMSFFEDKNIVVIPHVANQDMFNMCLEEAVECENQLILVHANYDNEFAVQSDHSLNVSRAQAKALAAKNTLMFGHVHQASNPMDGVIVAGNQWPSSVADCLGNAEKQAFIYDPSSRTVNRIKTWTAKDEFCQVDWDAIAATDLDGLKFIRVNGDCLPEQAPEMLAAISKLRQRSDALVITNAVSVAGVADMEDLPANLESVKGFDVLGYLFENLEPEQVNVVKSLMEKTNG